MNFTRHLMFELYQSWCFPAVLLAVAPIVIFMKSPSGGGAGVVVHERKRPINAPQPMGNLMAGRYHRAGTVLSSVWSGHHCG
jgi:hypothetical protein